MNMAAVITARGGSKGIPRKNVIDIGGKPLIAWSIEAALNSKHFNKVYVTTDDKEIADVSKKFGAEIINRPEELARDETPSLPVLQHAVSFLEERGEKVDAVTLLQPTSPLRTSEDIDRAVELFIEKEPDSLTSVCEADTPYWMIRIKDSFTEPFMEDGKKFTRRQNLPKVYIYNGAIYITKRAVLMEQNRIAGEKNIAYIMPKERSADIDGPSDIALVGALMKMRNDKSQSD